MSAGGSPVISYKVYVATAPGVQGRATSGSINGTGATVTGLLNGTVYYFMVTAVNATGNESPFSTEVSAEPGRGQIAVCAPPPANGTDAAHRLAGGRGQPWLPPQFSR